MPFPVAAYPVFGLCLDLLLGDPPSWPHPVRWIGRVLDVLEEAAGKVGNKRLFGAACVLFTAGAAFAAVKLLTAVPVLGVLFGVYFSFAGLALGGLLREGRRVAEIIDRGDLDAARRELGMLVSRDTAALDEAGLRRTLAETISENLCDGFTAPFLYLCLGGPALLWAYKAVSTMDSMWGYRTERFRELGWACAKTDDALAFVPARLTAVFLLLVGRCAGRGASLKAVRADAAKMSSPNAGWPMAAAARIVGAPMGGPAAYFGKRVDKPALGPSKGEWDAPALARLFSLGLFSCLALAAVLLGLVWAVSPFL